MDVNRSGYKCEEIVVKCVVLLDFQCSITSFKMIQKCITEPIDGIAER